jgi:translation elongation factor EF-1alpha
MLIVIMPEKQLIGTVRHFYTHLNVAIVDLTKPLTVGDMVAIEGTTTKFEQKAESIQIEHANVTRAKPGDSIGLKVDQKVREGDKVYKIS